MNFPDTPLRRGLCDCSICRELRDWWWQAMWTTALVIAIDHETSNRLGWYADQLADAEEAKADRSAGAAEPMWTREKVQAALEKEKANCAKGEHWTGLNADLTPATRCAWDFCEYGKDDTMTPTKLEDDRCAWCGWPLGNDLSHCMRGNCSMRPLPTAIYDYERAMLEARDKTTREYIRTNYAGVADDSSSNHTEKK